MVSSRLGLQLFLADATVFRKNILPSKVANFTAQFEIFSTANWPKASSNLVICSKQLAHQSPWDLDIMTLIGSFQTFVWLCQNLSDPVSQG